LTREAGDSFCGVLGVGHEDVTPDADGARGDASGIEEAFAAEKHFVRVAGTDEGGGEGVRKVADTREDPVVLGRGHGRESHTQGLPELTQALEVAGGGARCGSEDAVGVVEKVRTGKVDAALLGAGHGVRADKLDIFIKVFSGPSHREHFGRTDVGHKAVGVEVRTHGGHEVGKDADGARKDDKLGTLNGLGKIVGNFVNGPDVGGFVSGDGAVAVADAFNMGEMPADSQAEGAAEQAEADNRRLL